MSPKTYKTFPFEYDQCGPAQYNKVDTLQLLAQNRITNEYVHRYSIALTLRPDVSRVARVDSEFFASGLARDYEFLAIVRAVCLPGVDVGVATALNRAAASTVAAVGVYMRCDLRRCWTVAGIKTIHTVCYRHPITSLNNWKRQRQIWSGTEKHYIM